MSRKANYGYDYDDAYDDYDEYEDYENYDDDYEVNGKAAVAHEETTKVNPRVWRCSICTYDNDESMSYCEICGTLCCPPSITGSDINSKTVWGLGKDYGISRLATSLFASLPRQTRDIAVPPLTQSLTNEIGGGNTCLDSASRSRCHTNIEPFKFDDPSPDDIIFNRLHSAKISSKVWGLGKDYGISRLATSLFASLPRQTRDIAVPPLTQSLTNEIGGGNTCLDSASRSRCHTNIEPFKFDDPSPDDIISNRLHSAKISSKGALPRLPENKAATTQPSARRTNSSLTFKGIKNHLEENNRSSGEREKYFNDTSTVLRNDDSVAGPSNSIRADRTPNLKFNHDNKGETSSVANGQKPETLTSLMDSMSLNSKPGSSKSIVPKKARAQYQPEKWMLPDKVGNVMTQLNLAIVGHVDSGKSTLSGRLLHLLGQISPKQMHKYEKESKQQGKGSFAYAWALDESAEERERGITMTVAVAYFNSKKYHVVVLDSPGHKDFVPNMISGATQADAAILVIDASIGAYETGMDVIGGQSREHAQLIRSFGVDQIIVAINKMDIVGYSNERFESIKHQVGFFLRQCGFKESSILWVPLSAMQNQNLVEAASDERLKSWYKGPHLLGAIDSLNPPRREYEKPLVMPICDVIKTHSMGQVSASGKLEAGALRSGCKVLVMPLGELATVKSIQCNSQPCAVARAGDNISVILQGIDIGNVIAGGVLCHLDFPVKVSSRLEIKILVMEAVKVPILIGSQLEFHTHHAKEAARVVKIVSLLDPKTGKETKKAPRCLLSKQSALIEVGLQGAVCVEEFSICKALGRVFLRSSGRTIAVGVVTRVIEDTRA